MKLVDAVEMPGLKIATAGPPKPLRTLAELCVVVPQCAAVQRIHALPPPLHHQYAPRAVKTPGGDLLLMFAAGRGHMWHGRTRDQCNCMVFYRSSDGGETWAGPAMPLGALYNHNSGTFIVPPGSKRITMLCTEPHPEWFDWPNFGIAMRTSDDDGRTWSAPRRIRPVNDPRYLGQGHMQMCRTDAGTWLIGTYVAIFGPKTNMGAGRIDRQFLLRSADEGETWTLLPDKRPTGWFAPGRNVMIEAKPVPLGGKRVLLAARAPGGHVWELRSDDDGKTWSPPKQMPLVHPDAPPMIFRLPDAPGGKVRLIALHHNRYDPAKPQHDHSQRGELWVSTSDDEGATWADPRLLLIDAAAPAGGLGPNREVSYADLLVEGDTIHVFSDHQNRAVLHVRLKLADLAKLPTKAQLH